jgi:hypothetical protein
LNASDINGAVEVQTSGFITHSGWNFIANTPIYIGNGVLVNSEPIANFVIIVGYASSPYTVVIKPQPIIFKG